MMTFPGFTALNSVRTGCYRGRAHDHHGSDALTPQLRRFPFSTALICSGIRSQCESACLERFVWDLDTGNPGPALDALHDCNAQCFINSINCNAYGEFYL